MKTAIKTKLTENPEFLAWLQSQDEDTLHDLSRTYFYRERLIERNKRLFRVSSIILIAMFSALLAFSFMV